jgi:hypothetical protein
MATEIFAETLDNSKYSTRLIPESRNFILNASHENLRSRMFFVLPVTQWPRKIEVDSVIITGELYCLFFIVLPFSL